MSCPNTAPPLVADLLRKAVDAERHAKLARELLAEVGHLSATADRAREDARREIEASIRLRREVVDALFPTTLPVVF
jgi:hypothetical protein